MIASTQTNHPLATAKTGGRNPSAVELACTKLRAAGLRITQPRMAILGALIKRGEPVSIDTLHADLGPKTCDVVTIYRCMAAFEAIGLVRRAFLINGTTLYQIALGEPARYHAVCKTTNRIEEIEPETSAELRRVLLIVEDSLRAKGYADVGHIVEFFGIAPAAGRPAPEVSTLTAPQRQGIGAERPAGV